MMRGVVLGLVLLVSGCVTVQDAQHLTVRPGAEPVTVTTTARVHCQDALVFFWCRLNMEMESSDGQRVSDFPTK